MYSNIHFASTVADISSFCQHLSGSEHLKKIKKGFHVIIEWQKRTPPLGFWCNKMSVCYIQYSKTFFFFFFYDASHSMWQTHLKVGVSRKQQWGYWKYYHGYVFAFSSVSLSCSWPTEWCLSTTERKADGKLFRCCCMELKYASDHYGRNQAHPGVMFPSLPNRSRGW